MLMPAIAATSTVGDSRAVRTTERIDAPWTSRQTSPIPPVAEPLKEASSLRQGGCVADIPETRLRFHGVLPPCPHPQARPSAARHPLPHTARPLQPEASNYNELRQDLPRQPHAKSAAWRVSPKNAGTTIPKWPRNEADAPRPPWQLHALNYQAGRLPRERRAVHRPCQSC